jgi:hypothetical protein
LKLRQRIARCARCGDVNAVEIAITFADATIDTENISDIPIWITTLLAHRCARISALHRNSAMDTRGMARE